jgi:hypothetical protein
MGLEVLSGGSDVEEEAMVALVDMAEQQEHAVVFLFFQKMKPPSSGSVI